MHEPHGVACLYDYKASDRAWVAELESLHTVCEASDRSVEAAALVYQAMQGAERCDPAAPQAAIAVYNEPHLDTYNKKA